MGDGSNVGPVNVLNGGKKKMSVIALSELGERQAAPNEPINAVVGKSFEIKLHFLPPNEHPGPTWLAQYDDNYLTVQESGVYFDQQGDRFFWVTFVPTKAGNTQVLLVQQPHLINPLFISHYYDIQIAQ